jgi:hypothetical protein
MKRSQKMAETMEKKAVYDLAFGVYPHGDNLFSAKIIKIKDGKVTEWRHGTGTSLGHACAMAENLLSGYALVAHETSAISFYDDARLM